MDRHFSLRLTGLDSVGDLGVHYVLEVEGLSEQLPEAVLQRLGGVGQFLFIVL